MFLELASIASSNVETCSKDPVEHFCISMMCSDYCSLGSILHSVHWYPVLVAAAAAIDAAAATCPIK